MSYGPAAAFRLQGWPNHRAIFVHFDFDVGAQQGEVMRVEVLPHECDIMTVRLPIRSIKAKLPGAIL
jgi:hypothetical protein